MCVCLQWGGLIVAGLNVMCLAGVCLVDMCLDCMGLIHVFDGNGSGCYGLIVNGFCNV